MMTLSDSISLLCYVVAFICGIRSGYFIHTLRQKSSPPNPPYVPDRITKGGLQPEPKEFYQARCRKVIERSNQMALHNLRQHYQTLTEAERDNVDYGVALANRIRELTEQLKDTPRPRPNTSRPATGW